MTEREKVSPVPALYVLGSVLIAIAAWLDSGAVGALITLGSAALIAAFAAWLARA